MTMPTPAIAEELIQIARNTVIQWDNHDKFRDFENAGEPCAVRIARAYLELVAPAPDDGPITGIYVASKTKHAPMWRRFRDNGFPIISTWIDEAGAGETSDWADLWDRCVNEAKNACAVLLYCEPDDFLKGALVEIGAALAHGKPVYIVGNCPSVGSFTNHRLVTRCDSIYEAFSIEREKLLNIPVPGAAGE